MQRKQTRLLQLAGENRGFIINSLLIAAGGLTSLKLGKFCAENADNVFGTGSWRTPNFLGNSGRSPIFPHIPKPYIDDIEGRKNYEY